MKLLTKLHTTMLAISLLVGHQKINAQQNWSTQQIGSTLTIAGIIGLCVGGLMMASDSIGNWFNPLNKTIIEDAQKDFSKHFEYEPFLHSTKEAYNIQSRWLSECAWIKKEMNEPLLYNIARTLWDSNKTVSNFFWEFKKYVDTLAYQRNQLNNRIARLLNIKDLDYLSVKELHTMRALVTDIEAWHIELQALYSYLDYHRSFFDLAQAEWQMYWSYQRELAAFDTYAHDNYYLTQELTRIVKEKYHTNTYPSIAYTQQLETDIQKIRSSRANANRNYADRFVWTDECIRKLQLLRSMIDYWYKQEVLQNNTYRAIALQEEALREQRQQLKRLQLLTENALNDDSLTVTLKL